jgi:hypothetical protein
LAPSGLTPLQIPGQLLLQGHFETAEELYRNRLARQAGAAGLLAALRRGAGYGKPKNGFSSYM